MDKFKRTLYRMEYKYGRFAIHNLMIYICSTMLAVYFLQMLIRIPVIQYLSLYRGALLQGQIWRVITFIFIPPMSSPFWLLISLYFYYFIGSSLEHQWGAFKFNLYYFTGIVATVLAALISGYGDATYLNLSLFLAFAQLFPDTEFMLFFIIPVKAKWLAYLDWALFAWNFLFGSFSVKVTILFAIANFMLFFGKDFINDIRYNLKYRDTRNNYRKAMRDNDRRGR
ncbi:MAG: hypothetical protein RSF82_05025 [Angelakisella sp.]